MMSMFDYFPGATGAFTATLIAVATCAAADATTLMAPTGAIVLTVTGEIENTNADGAAQFDLEMLEALPATEFTTSTIWTEGPQTFRGVLLSDFLEIVGSTSDALSAQAINDYAVDIPASDAIQGGPIIAYKQNGDYMSRRDKGPLWIVYPYDSDTTFQSEVIYSRSIWQLDRVITK